MVIPGDHMFSAKPDIIDHPTVNHGLVGGFRDAMGLRTSSRADYSRAGQGGGGRWHSAARQ